MSQDFAMLKKIAFAAISVMVAAAPAFAGGYAGQYRGYFRPHWNPYPNYAAFIPYGLPMTTSTRTLAFVPSDCFADNGTNFMRLCHAAMSRPTAGPSEARCFF